MSDNQTTNKKEKDWKEYLLKSSLPLEQLVSDKLESMEMGIAGEYPYIRPNEQGINTEFSIDLCAFDFIGTQLSNIGTVVKHAAKLNLLIECKYNHPSVKWVFSPYPDMFTGSLTLYRMQKHLKHSTFELGIDTEEAYFPSCRRGIELFSNGYDPNNISRGLSQLRYGMPNLILQETSELNSLNRRFITEQSLIGLMLVTTADLYVLRSRQDFETYRTSVSLEDVADQVNALVGQPTNTL